MIDIFQLFGIEQPPDLQMWIEHLIYNSTLEEHEKVEAEQLNDPEADIPEEVLEHVIRYLLENQADPVTSGRYNQTDLYKFLNKICDE